MQRDARVSSKAGPFDSGQGGSVFLLFLRLAETLEALFGTAAKGIRGLWQGGVE
jgi:hypothetical protein